MTSTPTSPNARFPWTPILALAGGTLWTVTAELLPAGLLLDISQDTGVAPGTVGYLVTAWGVAIAALSLPLARLTRRLDRRTVLISSLALTGAATVLTSLAPTYPLLLAARILAAAGHGLFWALVVVAAGSLVAEQHAGRAIALVIAGPTVASVAVIPVATALGEAAGWRFAFGTVGLLTIMTGGLLARALPRMATPPQVARGTRDPSVGAVVKVAALGAVLLVAHFMAFTFVAPILTGSGGPGGTSVSLALLVFGATGAVGLLLAPPLCRRLSADALPLIGALLAVSLLGIRVAGASQAVVLTAVAAWGLVIGALPVVFQTRLFTLASPAFRPTAGAVIVVAFNLGIASGATAGGVLYHHIGAGPLPVIGAALALATSVVLAAWRRPGRRPKAGPASVMEETLRSGEGDPAAAGASSRPTTTALSGA